MARDLPRWTGPALNLLLIIVGAAVLLWGYSQRDQTAINVDWSTATEIDTAGFNIYRSTSPDGPFTQVNDTIISASPDPLTGGTYQFTDTDVVPDQTYYYELEDVEVNGNTTRHGPITAVANPGGQTQLAVGGLLLAAGAIATFLLWQHRRSVRIS